MMTQAAQAVNMYWENRGMAVPQMTQKLSLKKRSVTIAGHGTSVSLENAFWDALKDICEERGVSMNAMITEIDKERTGNLSSAIRVYILENMRR
jgi:predicted DNA-binding ribbon-helix-helix protein